MDRLLNILNHNTIEKESSNISKDLTFRDREILQAHHGRIKKQLPQLEIERIGIGVYGEKELLRTAVVRIDRDGTSGYGTVNDPRMGTTERTHKCDTCGEIMCHGHLGYIKLPCGIYHPFYIKDVANILNCLCPYCGALLITHEEFYEEQLHLYKGFKRLRKIAAFCDRSQVSCFQNKCRGHLRLYKGNDKDDIITYTEKLNHKNKHKFEIDPLDAKKIFRRFQGKYPEQVKLLGFASDFLPSDLILEMYPIIPPIARPPAYDSGKVRIDNLTKVYTTFVRLNNSLTAELGRAVPNKTKVMEKTNTIKFFIRHIMQNSDGKMKQPQPLECLTGRVKGKKGVIRNNIMGKRCNFNARSVANPDPTLPFGTVLVPRCLADTLTYPEKVADYNIQWLQQLMHAGEIVRIVPGTGDHKGLVFKVDCVKRWSYTLQKSDIVHRWLKDGDYVIVNRHPTLHRQGMMCHRVRLSDDLDCKVIGLHLSVVVAFNADFDGDEINVHIPQTIEEVAEARFVANVNNCIIDESTNKPLTGLHFDNLMAVTKLTQNNKILSEYQFLDLMAEIFNLDRNSVSSLDQIDSHIARISRFGIPLYSGYSVFSALLPADFCYSRADVVIKNGVLLSGTLTQSDVGNKHRSIVQVLNQRYGMMASAKFIDSASRMLNRFLMFFPVSIGFRDCLPENLEEHNRIITNELANMQKIVIDVCRGDKKPLTATNSSTNDPMSRHTPDYSKYEEINSPNFIDFPVDLSNSDLENTRRETDIMAQLTSTSDKLAVIAYENLEYNNTFMLTNISGAKGSKFNLVQMRSVLGQQFFYGERFNQHLAYHRYDDLDVEAKGYVSNSFLKGLNPAEIVIHAAASRVGVLDTATKTPLTGTTQRCFIKFLEGLQYKDGAIINFNREIVQFQYGEDSCNAAEMILYNDRNQKYTTFIDLQTVVDELNCEHGYVL